MFNKGYIMKKKKLLVCIGLVACASCFAQDDVTINLSSGKKVYKVEDIKSMTFEGNVLKINKQSADADSYQLADVLGISFDTTSGVENLKVEGEKLSINVKAGSNLIEINGYNGKKQYTIGIYNLSGEKVLGYDNWKGETVDISALPQGIYVFKINNTTLKFRK